MACSSAWLSDAMSQFVKQADKERSLKQRQQKMQQSASHMSSFFMLPGYALRSKLNPKGDL
jgi:hypothetical protein